MKSKNIAFKVIFTIFGLLALVSIFLPLISEDVIFATIKVSIFQLLTDDTVDLFFGGSDEMLIARVGIIAMAVIQLLAILLVWIIKSKAKVIVHFLGGLYETAIAAYLIFGFVDYGLTPGIGLFALLAAGVIQIIVSVLFLIMGQNEGEGAGAAQVASGTATAGKAMPRMSGSIIATEGEFSGASFPVGFEQVLIGRNSEVCNIVLSEATVSRKHCGIRFDATRNMYLVTNYSDNGTYFYGGTKLEAGENALNPGDSIQIGTSVFRLE